MREYMRKWVWEAAEWTDIIDFVDVSPQSYPSRALASLAPSAATGIKPNVFVVDEVLSVGDASFQVRSRDRMKSLIDGGASVVIVSHNLEMVEELAGRAMWLDHGRKVMLWDPGDVIAAYKQTVEGTPA